MINEKQKKYFNFVFFTISTLLTNVYLIVNSLVTISLALILFSGDSIVHYIVKLKAVMPLQHLPPL